MQVEALTSPATQVTPVTSTNGITPNTLDQTNFGQLFQLFTMQYGQGISPDTLNALMPQTIDSQTMLAILGQAGSPSPLQLLSTPTNLVNESQISQTDLTAALQTLLNQLSDQLPTETVSQALPDADFNLENDSEASLDPATLNGLLSLFASLQNTSQALRLDQPALQPEIVTKAFQALAETPSAQQAIAGLAQQNTSSASIPTPAISTEAPPEQPAFTGQITTGLSQTQAEVASQSQATPTAAATLPTTEQQPEFVDALQTVSEPTVTPAEVEVETPNTPVLTPISPQNVAPVDGVSNPVIVERPANLPTTPVLNQVAEAIVVTQAEGKTDVRLTLQPEALGQVLVQLQLNDGDLSVRLLAETAQAQIAIRDHLPQLKSALAAQGLQVAGLTLDVGSDASDLNNSGQQSNNQPQAQPYPWHFSATTEADHPDLVASQAERQQLGLSSINYQV